MIFLKTKIIPKFKLPAIIGNEEFTIQNKTRTGADLIWEVLDTGNVIYSTRERHLKYTFNYYSPDLYIRLSVVNGDKILHEKSEKVDLLIDMSINKELNNGILTYTIKPLKYVKYYTDIELKSGKTIKKWIVDSGTIDLRNDEIVRLKIKNNVN